MDPSHFAYNGQIDLKIGTKQVIMLNIKHKKFHYDLSIRSDVIGELGKILTFFDFILQILG